MQMKMENKLKKFDRNKVKKLLEEENEFILDLLSTFDVPDSVDDEELDKMYLLDSKKKKSKNTSTLNEFKKDDTERAQTAEELEQRLEIIKNKMKSKKSKVSSHGIKKRELKKMKKEKLMFNKKMISVQKSLKNEKIKEEKLLEDNKDNIKPIKPIFNEEGKIVFSKFDFASHPGAKSKKSKKDKIEKNPKKILKNLKEQKKQITELIETGQENKAFEIKQELEWKKAFDRTEGRKVKDDPNLLLKSIKKKKDQKKKSKLKWKERQEKVENDISQRQKKRQDNINKKLKEKKTRKLKRLSKRGRVIPGF